MPRHVDSAKLYLMPRTRAARLLVRARSELLPRERVDGALVVHLAPTFVRDYLRLHGSVGLVGRGDQLMLEGIKAAFGLAIVHPQLRAGDGDADEGEWMMSIETRVVLASDAPHDQVVHEEDASGDEADDEEECDEDERERAVDALLLIHRVSTGRVYVPSPSRGARVALFFGDAAWPRVSAALARRVDGRVWSSPFLVLWGPAGGGKTLLTRMVQRIALAKVVPASDIVAAAARDVHRLFLAVVDADAADALADVRAVMDGERPPNALVVVHARSRALPVVRMLEERHDVAAEPLFLPAHVSRARVEAIVGAFAARVEPCAAAEQTLAAAVHAVRMLGADVTDEVCAEPADASAQLVPVRGEPLLAGLAPGARVDVHVRDGALDVAAGTSVERIYHEDVSSVAARIAHANEAVVVDAATAADVAFAYGALGVRTLHLVDADAPPRVLPAHSLLVRVTRR